MKVGEGGKIHVTVLYATLHFLTNRFLSVHFFLLSGRVSISSVLTFTYIATQCEGPIKFHVNVTCELRTAAHIAAFTSTLKLLQDCLNSALSQNVVSFGGL